MLKVNKQGRPFVEDKKVFFLHAQLGEFFADLLDKVFWKVNFLCVSFENQVLPKDGIFFTENSCFSLVEYLLSKVIQF